MYEEVTYEKILGRVLENVPNNVDKRQGSIIYDAVAPLCAELAQMYIAMDNNLKEAFADTASREYLILRAKEIGLEPKKATKAILKGEFNVNVPIGTAFALNTLRYKAIEKIEDCVFKMECQQEGKIGNTAFGNVIPVDYIPNLNSAMLTELLVAGEDEENTEDFRERYFENVSNKGFGGNRADYINWTKAVDGVGQVRVVRAFDGGGTVKTIITDSNNGIPTVEVCKRVKEVLDPQEKSGFGLGKAPVGHSVSVVGVRCKDITINIKLSVLGGYTVEAVKNNITNAIAAYFRELNGKFTKESAITVGSLQIMARVCNIEGINTISSLNIDGKTSVSLLEDEICGTAFINLEV